ncbi:MAG: acyltransferase family protein [Paracoccaceae bacterium]|nr:acyltransferase family protein [Paracoccaceae bacterium]
MNHTGRRHDLDNLRTALIVLVVLHHIALIYGGVAPFYYQETPEEGSLAPVLLGAFVLMNQAWFMGAMFFLAGYFTPGAIGRQGPSLFRRRRCIRLGVPILLGLFVLEPVSRSAACLYLGDKDGAAIRAIWSDYPDLIGLGPLWFVFLLLIFSIGSVLFPGGGQADTNNQEAGQRFAGPLPIAAFVLGLAAASFLCRMVIPIGTEFHLLSRQLNFPTMSYFPQYLALFTIGVAASKRGWLASLPRFAGWIGLATAVLATLVLFPVSLDPRWGLNPATGAPPFLGGGTWQSAVYALWDSAMVVGVGLSLLALFQRRLSGTGPVRRLMARHSYAVYVIHIPVLLYAALLLREIELSAMHKFALAAVVMVPLCFAAAMLARRLPGLNRVL